MEKEAVINILHDDLKEIATLLDSFNGKDCIPEPFIKLLESKIDGLKTEADLLRMWSSSETNSDSLNGKNSQQSIVITFDDDKEKSTESDVPDDENTITTEVSIDKLANAAIDLLKEEIAITKNKDAKQPQPAQTVEIQIEPDPAPAAKPKPQKPAEPSKANHNADDIKNYGTPVNDVRKAIGLNDRFLFIRELFAGNVDEMNTTIDIINAHTSYEQAYSYLSGHYGWDETRPEVESFYRIVKRRFI